MCEKTIVERMMSALELKCNVWILIEVKQPRKKIGKVRRNMIGLPGNKNDRLLIYLKVQDWQGIKRTRAVEIIGWKSRTKKNKIENDASYVEIHL